MQQNPDKLFRDVLHELTQKLRSYGAIIPDIPEHAFPKTRFSDISGYDPKQNTIQIQKDCKDYREHMAEEAAHYLHAFLEGTIEKERDPLNGEGTLEEFIGGLGRLVLGYEDVVLSGDYTEKESEELYQAREELKRKKEELEKKYGADIESLKKKQEMIDEIGRFVLDVVLSSDTPLSARTGSKTEYERVRGYISQLEKLGREKNAEAVLDVLDRAYHKGSGALTEKEKMVLVDLHDALLKTSEELSKKIFSYEQTILDLECKMFMAGVLSKSTVEHAEGYLAARIVYEVGLEEFFAGCPDFFLRPLKEKEEYLESFLERHEESVLEIAKKYNFTPVTKEQERW